MTFHHMKPLKPLKAPLPLTLSDEASSEAVGFLSFGLSLMFCAPPVLGGKKESQSQDSSRLPMQENLPRP